MIYHKYAPFHSVEAPKRNTTANVPNPAGLNMCLPLNLIRCLEPIANTEASAIIHHAWPPDNTQPIMRPETIELSVIVKFFVFRYVKKESVSMALIRPMASVNKNSVSFAVKDTYNANNIRKILNWSLTDLIMFNHL